LFRIRLPGLYLIEVAKKKKKKEHPCFVPDHRKKSSSLSVLMLASGFSYMAFIIFR
jgi:hypothetical protein